jgi:hypothetical protein
MSPEYGQEATIKAFDIGSTLENALNKAGNEIVDNPAKAVREFSRHYFYDLIQESLLTYLTPDGSNQTPELAAPSEIRTLSFLYCICHNIDDWGTKIKSANQDSANKILSLFELQDDVIQAVNALRTCATDNDGDSQSDSCKSERQALRHAIIAAFTSECVEEKYGSKYAIW